MSIVVIHNGTHNVIVILLWLLLLSIYNKTIINIITSIHCYIMYIICYNTIIKCNTIWNIKDNDNVNRNINSNNIKITISNLHINTNKNINKNTKTHIKYNYIININTNLHIDIDTNSNVDVHTNYNTINHLNTNREFELICHPGLHFIIYFK